MLPVIAKYGRDDCGANVYLHMAVIAKYGRDDCWVNVYLHMAVIASGLKSLLNVHSTYSAPKNYLQHSNMLRVTLGASRMPYNRRSF